MEKNPEVGATYSLKYFFKGEREYTNIGAMPPSPFVSTFSMTAVPNGALIKREAVMNCGGYANIAPGLGDDVILFSRLGERYRCELRGTPRVMGRCHENSFASKTDFAGYKGYYQDIRARLLRRPLEVRMLENFQIPDLPDFQVLALAGGIFYVRQSQIDFTLKFLAFLVSRYPYDFGLQNIYMTFLLKYRRFDEFDSHWQKLDTFGNNFLFSSAMWLSSLAEIAQQVGHPQPRLNEINIALQNYLSNLPPQVKDFLKR